MQAGLPPFVDTLEHIPISLFVVAGKAVAKLLLTHPM